MNGKATSKPAEIDWFKWEQNDFDLDQWVQSFGQKYLDHFISVGKGEDTTEQDLYVNPKGNHFLVPTGYIIIRGTDGKYSACDPNIFKETYNI